MRRRKDNGFVKKPKQHVLMVNQLPDLSCPSVLRSFTIMINRYILLLMTIFLLHMVGIGQCAENQQVKPLIKLIMDGLERNPRVRSAQAKLTETESKKRVSMADLLPQLALKGTSAYEVSRLETMRPEYTPARVGVDMSQVLYDRKTFMKYGSSNIEILAMGLQFENTRQEVLFEMLNNMVNLLKARETADLLKSYADIIEKHLAATQLRSDIGELTMTDVNQARSRLATAKTGWLDARNEIRRQEVIFVELFDTLPAQVIDLPFFDSLLLRLAEDDLAALAQERPDIMAQKYLVELAQRNIDMEKSGHYPTISLNLSSYRQENITHEPSLPEYGPKYGYDVGLVLNLPLYSGGKTTALTEQATEKIKAENSEQKRLIRLAIREVKEAISDRESANLVLSNYDNAVEAAKSTLEGVDLEFQMGTKTSLDLLNTQLELFNTMVGRVASRYKEVMARLRLYKSVGRLEEVIFYPAIDHSRSRKQ